MDALRRSVQAESKGGAAAKPVAARKGRKTAAGQKEMLLPIAGKKAARETAREEHAAKPHRAPARQRKAG